MMDTGYLNVIARNAWKLLARNRLFQIYFFLVFAGIIFFQVMEQSNMGPYPNRLGEFGLSSFFPYVNAYLFSFLLIVPLIFVVPFFRKGDTRQDAIYYRPESNSEYVWGISFGYVWGFFLMGCMSCICSMFVHLFMSDFAFDISIYLFYLFVLILPTIVFSFGLCLFVKCVVNHHLLSLLVLLLYFWVAVFETRDIWPGVFDFTGLTLPNAFSEVTGHPDLFPYLLHRLAYFLAGVGFIQLTVLAFKRLANTPGKCLSRVSVAFVLLAISLGAAVIFFWLNNEDMGVRRVYAETDSKYSSFAKGTLSCQSLRFEQQGDRMEVECRAVICNRTTEILRKVVFYLNPGLQINSFRFDGKEVAFERENQVVVAERQIVPGDSVILDIIYAGRVDERVCYLDMPLEVIKREKRAMDFICPFGKRYAFLDEEFTLLTPEVLWYPTTKPAINARAPYVIDKDFTRFSLEVVAPGDKTVISQGEKKIEDGVISFVNEQALTGISLCIGDYETRTATIGSVFCELHVFKRSSSFFDIIDSYKNSPLEKVKRKVESQMGRSYPFRRFALVETPVAFASYYRYGWGSSGFVQPELVFLPERYAKQRGDYSGGVNLSTDLMYDLFQERGTRLISWWSSLLILGSKDFSNLMMAFDELDHNPYNVSPMFFNYVQTMPSDSCPILDILNKMLLNSEARDRFSSLWRNSGTETEAINYLTNHGLDEMMADVQLDDGVKRDILGLKVMEFLNYFESRAVASDSLQFFLCDYLNSHLFQTIDFVRFDSAFLARFGCRWSDKLSSWFKSDKIPVYMVKDLAVKRVDDIDASTTTLVEFSIYNDGDADGVIRLQSSDFPYRVATNQPFGWGSIRQAIDTCFQVKAGTGRKIAMLVPESNPFYKLDLGVAHNIPRQISFYCHKGPCVDNYVAGEWSLCKEDFLPEKNEIVVDNEDPVFRIEQPSRKLSLYGALTGKDSVFDRYANVNKFVRPDSHSWITLVENNAYGFVNRSIVARMGGGDGKSWVEWRTNLKRAGKYELFVHIPEFSGMNTIYDNVSLSRLGKQDYTIMLPAAKHEISIDVPLDYGWVSLGEFDCAPGESVVMLHDSGDPIHIIIGDAVKWVYMGEKMKK